MRGSYHHTLSLLVEMRLDKFLSRLALNHNALNVGLPSSWDYRSVPPCPAIFLSLMLYFKKTSTPQKVAQIVKLTIYLVN
jgi:hypothetical protein